MADQTVASMTPATTPLNGAELLYGVQSAADRKLTSANILNQPTAAQINSISFDNTNHDVILTRDASNILAQRNGTSAQCYRCYNTYTDSSNFERGVFDWTTTANTLYFRSEAAGTGTVRNVVVRAGNGPFVQLFGGGGIVIDCGSGTFQLSVTGRSYYASNATFLTGTDNAVDLGRNDLQWKDLYLGGTAIFGLDTGISRAAPGIIAFGKGGIVGDASATIQAKTTAGAPTTTDVPASTWALIRDTTNNTTKVYYNNAGTLMSVALT
jgi:hypothetical protein